MFSRKLCVQPRCQYRGGGGGGKKNNPIQRTSVFQLENFHPNIHVSVSLVELYDMIDVSIPFQKHDKIDFFGSFGLDYNKVVKHIDTVAYLERCLNANVYKK